jgi:putative SOS response-associated peptidase YedK
MPVIVPPHRYEIWLDPDVREFDAVKLLKTGNVSLETIQETAMRLPNARTSSSL